MAAPRICCVAGARPNFMKIAPIVAALEERGAPTLLVHTGQHYDPALSDVFFDELGMREPDHHLEVGSDSHARQTARVMETFEPVVLDWRPDIVVVVGDVNSTMACALVAAKLPPAVAHVEAGLRSRDWSMPEEVNRVVTDRVSDYLLTPSVDGAENLRQEGFAAEQIHVVGNVMIDSLLRNLDRARARSMLGDLGLTPRNYGLVTLHRPSNVDHPEVLQAIIHAFDEISGDLPLVFPVHPRTRERLVDIEVPEGLRLLEPIGYLDTIALQADAAVVLTDSGGIQEETTVLGVPCLTLRPNTERPITITEGTNQLVGVDPERIVAAARSVLADRRPPGEAPRPALWDGKTADRIADILLA